MTKILGYAVSPVLSAKARFSKKAASASWASAERTLSLDSTISSRVYVPAFPKT